MAVRTTRVLLLRRLQVRVLLCEFGRRFREPRVEDELAKLLAVSAFQLDEDRGIAVEVGDREDAS